MSSGFFLGGIVMLRNRIHLLAVSGVWFLFVTGAAFTQELTVEQINHELNRVKDLATNGRIAELAALYERILPSAEKVYVGDRDKNIAALLSNLADAHRKLGNYQKAEPLFQRSLKIYEARGEDQLDMLPTLTNLANLYFAMRQYTKAEPLYLRALELRQKKSSGDDLGMAVPLYNLARFYYSMGEYRKAEPLYERSEKIWASKQLAEAAFAMIGLADLYAKIGENTKAAPLYVRGCGLLEEKRGKDHEDLATALNSHADFCSSQGQYAKAENFYERSLQICVAKLGKDHPHVANTLSNLAGVYNSTGQYSKAEPLYQRTLQITQARLGADHLNVARAFHNVGWTSASMGQWSKAVDHFQKARLGAANYLAEVLPIMSENEQLNWLDENYQQGFHRALSVAWTAPSESSAATAEWLLNGKAIAHQALAEQIIRARDARNHPDAMPLLDGLQDIRAQLSSLVNILPKAGREAEYQKELQELRARERELAQKLARKVERSYRAEAWVSLDQLRARLGPKTAFIDIARFPVFDFKGNKKLKYRYVAWITLPQGQGPVQVIDLGEAEPIDRLVEEARKILLDAPKKNVPHSVRTVGEPDALKILEKPLGALSAKVLHPLLPSLEKYEEWIVCPDGALWLTPWNALLLPKGEFAVEKYLIRHVVSGRDLLLDLPSVKTKSSYVFADPDYDLSPTKVMAAAGLRGGGGPSLLGKRLNGAIGTWKVTFEFLANEVVIRDEETKGEVGKGTWKQQGKTLTIQTTKALFEGTLGATEIRGQRSVREANGATTNDAFRMDSPRGFNDDVRSGASLGKIPKVVRLDGTAYEAEAIRPKLQLWLGQEPELFLEEKASKVKVKAVKNPRVLVLATHGYFLESQEIDTKNGRGEGRLTAALVDTKGQASRTRKDTRIHQQIGRASCRERV